jgi:mannose-6-phosphate isomerase-like protein (cupin superfamily)
MSNTKRFPVNVNGMSGKVTQISMMRSDFSESVISKTLFSNNIKINTEAKHATILMLRRAVMGMAPKDDRSILIKTYVFEPLTQAQAEANNDRTAINAGRAGGVAAIASGGLVRKGFKYGFKKIAGMKDSTKAAVSDGAGGITGFLTNGWVRDTIIKNSHHHHVDDVWIIVEFNVNGGIGQQHSIGNSVLRASEY